MAKFSQYTLNQVAGFNNQILAQELVYNQKDFWNMSWATETQTTGGWVTGTKVLDLTGTTISAQIVRREIINLTDTRTGLNFDIVNYPFPKVIDKITATVSSDDTLTCTNTGLLFINQPIQFTGATFGGVSINTTYYVKSIITNTTFTISATSGGPTLQLTDGTGLMYINKVAPTPINLPITNRNNIAGTFTLELDDNTWNLIAGDPELNINSETPACFTGRIKISFPQILSQPAYDEYVFLLFLVRSDGVINNG